MMPFRPLDLVRRGWLTVVHLDLFRSSGKLELVHTAVSCLIPVEMRVVQGQSMFGLST